MTEPAEPRVALIAIWSQTRRGPLCINDEGLVKGRYRDVPEGYEPLPVSPAASRAGAYMRRLWRRHASATHQR